MKLKLHVWTDKQGVKHYITSFHWSGDPNTWLSMEIIDGLVQVGPKVPTADLPEGLHPKCQLVEVELILPQ
jgi:hypothetical protein